MGVYLRVAVLAWWFLFMSDYHRSTSIATVVGPFQSREQCDLVRDKALKNGNAVWCWWDGKS